jgi:hypothetical protein
LPGPTAFLAVCLVSAWRRSPTQLYCRGFGFRLSPVLFRRRPARPVSCYALFKWWLLLSQHPGCLRRATSLSTEPEFGALSDGLGCFPLDHEGYPPRSDSRACKHGIRSLTGRGGLAAPPPNQSLYLRVTTPEARPKAISGRTSYLRVRLAFHSPSRLVPELFNVHEFGPPRPFTGASAWP